MLIAKRIENRETERIASVAEITDNNVTLVAMYTVFLSNNDKMFGMWEK